MLIRRPRSGCRRTVATVALGLLLTGAAAVPAHAEGMRGQQWFLDAMKAEQMWQISTGKGVTVAVIDTGVQADNPDLKGRVLPGRDFAVGQPGDAHTDYDGHGTGMAGLIAGTGAANGGNGTFGLAPGAKILPVRLPKSTAPPTGRQPQRSSTRCCRRPFTTRWTQAPGSSTFPWQRTRVRQV